MHIHTHADFFTDYPVVEGETAKLGRTPFLLGLCLGAGAGMLWWNELGAGS